MLVDSWLVLAGGAGVVELAGCDASVVAGVVSEAAGAASVAGVAAGGSGKAFGLPGVTVSTAAVFPMLEGAATAAFGCSPKPMVSSPDSLAGVMVGGPVREAAETSGLVFRKLMVRLIIPGRSADC